MGVSLIQFRHVPLEEDKSTWKIAVPTSLPGDLIRWFHSVLGHTGESRVYDSIQSRYQHPQLKRRISQLLSACETCRLHKQSGAGFGELAERDVVAAPWQKTHVDLIEPWRVAVNGIDVEFLALTVIDPITNLIELVRIDNKTSDHVAQNLPTLGCHVTPGQGFVFMTMAVNFLDFRFNNCWKNVLSAHEPLQLAIPKQTQYARGCIRPWETYCDLCCMENR
jgi:hypothetical protein